MRAILLAAPVEPLLILPPASALDADGLLVFPTSSPTTATRREIVVHAVIFMYVLLLVVRVSDRRDIVGDMLAIRLTVASCCWRRGRDVGLMLRCEAAMRLAVAWGRWRRRRNIRRALNRHPLQTGLVAAAAQATAEAAAAGPTAATESAVETLPVAAYSSQSYIACLEVSGTIVRHWREAQQVGAAKTLRLNLLEAPFHF